MRNRINSSINFNRLLFAVFHNFLYLDGLKYHEKTQNTKTFTTCITAIYDQNHQNIYHLPALCKRATKAKARL